jgi:hypothetical protein
MAFVTGQPLEGYKENQLWRFVTSRGCVYVSNQWFHHGCPSICACPTICAYPSICDGEVLDAILLYEKTGEPPDNSRMHDKEREERNKMASADLIGCGRKRKRTDRKKEKKNRHNESVARQKARVARRKARVTIKRVKKRVRQAAERPFGCRSETDHRLRRFISTYLWPARKRCRQKERLLRADTKQQRELARQQRKLPRHVVVALEEVVPIRDILDIVISYARD